MQETISDLYIESIKYSNNQLINPSYHLERLNRTIKDIFNVEPVVKESDIFKPLTSDNNIYKLRITYADELLYTELIPYLTPLITKLQVVISYNIDYAYKSLNRSKIEEL